MNIVADTLVQAPRAADPAPIPPARRFGWLLRREFWENRGGFLWAPLVAGAVSLLLAAMGIVIAMVVNLFLASSALQFAISVIGVLVFLGAFVLGMFLTPPDVISQTLLALPMYLLYEAGLIMSRIMLPEKTGAVEDEA